MLLLLWGLENEKNWLRWLYCLPCGLTVIIGTTARFVPESSTVHTVFFDPQGGWLWTHPVALVTALLFFGSVGFCLWRVDRKLLLAFVIVLLCRMSMGISSSLFHSGLRTFYPLFYVFVAASAVLLSSLQKFRKVGWITSLAISGIMLSVNIYSLLI